MSEGKFIVFYGINILGKTTQSGIISRQIALENSVRVHRIKYPIYNLDPTGSEINDYLRNENPKELTPHQHQELQLQNRFDYQPILFETLNSGIWVLAEDYTLTGIAWGIATGVDENFLRKKTNSLMEEDFGILFDGEQFNHREESHKYETNYNLTKKCREIHLRLAEEFGIPVINANQEKEKVTKDILNILKEWGLMK
ncbi:hypothetical protein J4446_00925 [Candidatus Woesearchaeota archaeon]|nr:hypothetical protein [uncultured archaeon]MBS3143427.1 hypothetical protein [Candidatus Woesearchaeota archaeon]